ncbi:MULTISPECIES: DNA replication initiation control protein YabA [unclassified Enterococcus]|uniref:DNA replication initiation control protein YabA n=1 Tax=unclassified Enterococcus TaxID=2608891 RepID=UPI00155789DA|nr:DNA replication initiation control protein YabA [Enterococcus sp. MMGLQ5-2]MBS7585142.1 DNA replication initiation control protein YabA [Enterococcus sp. MMGLQ5-1]NPD12998.1 DNA replication initiation control protein YabA [Enterococcus sp. MMGLQ5-1]NPD37712.1 DNA replication initiation control protein YabA [Enterococcus sp. MMGLQ5-2]
MDKKKLVDNFNDLERLLTLIANELSETQQDLKEIVEENTTLRVENERLRERIDDLTIPISEDASKTVKSENSQKISKSRLNLENIYEEGFHICNQFYGQRRIDDEPCLFCMDVIYR